MLRLLVSGATNQEIADELVISVPTAKKHVSNLLGKLGVKSRSHAIARAHELSNLLEGDPQPSLPPTISSLLPPRTNYSFGSPSSTVFHTCLRYAGRNQSLHRRTK